MEEKQLSSSEEELIAGLAESNIEAADDFGYYAEFQRLRLASTFFGFHLSTLVFRVFFILAIAVFELNYGVFFALTFSAFVWTSLGYGHRQATRSNEALILALTARSGRQGWQDTILFRRRHNMSPSKNIMDLLAIVEPFIWLFIVGVVAMGYGNLVFPEQINGGSSSF